MKCKLNNESICQKNKQFNNKQQKARQLVNKTQQKILIELQKETITISQTQIPFQLLAAKKMQMTQSANNLETHLILKRIRDQKQAVEQKLHILEKEQKMTANEIKRRQLSLSRSDKGSKMSPQGSLKANTNIRKLKRQYENKKKLIQIRTKQLQERDQKAKEEQLYERQMMLQKINEHKKSQIELRLQKMKEKRQQRIQRLQEEKQMLKIIKSQKKLYQQLQQKWNSQQKQHQQLKRKRYQQKKQDYRSIDIHQLKIHEKRYEQIMQKNKQEMKRKRLDASRVNKTLSFEDCLKSRFYTEIVQQENRNKQSRDKKSKKIKQMFERRKQYSQVVKKYYTPKVVDKKQNIEKQKQLPRQALDVKQRNKKGLQNLKLNKSLVRKNKIEIQSQIETATPSKSISKPKYYDYLSQARKTRQQRSGALDSTATKSEIWLNRELKQAKRVMKKPNFSKQQKVQYVKILSQKMDLEAQKNHHKNNKDLESETIIQKIAAKIELLEAID